MKKVNLDHVPAEQRQSPGGKYAKTIKEISVALGRDPHSLDLAKRHPFDLTLVRIPPGKSYCPYHSHGAESELYLVISGRGMVRDKDGRSEVVAGDAFFFGPGRPTNSQTTGQKTSPITLSPTTRATTHVITPTAASGRSAERAPITLSSKAPRPTTTRTRNDTDGRTLYPITLQQRPLATRLAGKEM
jgi:uncharacterized cupin superfamily protein